MKKLSVLLFLSTLLALGCGGKDGKSAKSEGAESEKAKGGEAAIKVSDKDLKKGLDLAKEKIGGVAELEEKALDLKAALGGKKEGRMTLEAYEEAMLTLAKCEIKSRSIDRKCAEKKTFTETRRKMKSPKDTIQLGYKHIKHESPSVRLYAAGLMNSMMGASKKSVEVVLANIKTETDPAVTRQMLDVVGSKANGNPAVAQLLFDMSKHSSPLVRKEAVISLTSSFANKVDGSVERAVEMVNDDKDDGVRRLACERVGTRFDAKALPVLTQYTTDEAAAKDAKLYESCMKGLLAMWAGAPLFKGSHEPAFDLFIERITSEKCSKDVPPWTVLTSVGRAASSKSMGKAAPWFAKRKGELVKALTTAATCSNANWMSRNGAVKALGMLGADKTVFEGLRKAYDGMGSDNSNNLVSQEIDKQLK